MEAHLICKSQAMKDVMEKAAQLAPADVPILITGETGVGKTMLAQCIHNLSDHKDHPFVEMDAGALPPNLIESALFGHERGAFTGALQTQIGLIEQAHGGTLFIDEIHNLSRDVQSKYLKVLESGKFRRVGGKQELHAHFRLISAANGDLSRMLAQREFRSDLYFRIASVTLAIPPLRERREDILPLAEFYLQVFSHASGKPLALTDEAKAMLLRYSWPGNIRELKNVVQQAALLSTSEQLRPEDFALQLQCESFLSYTDEEGVSMDEMKRRYIALALRRTNGNLMKASRILKIGYSTLLRKVKKLGLNEARSK